MPYLDTASTKQPWTLRLRRGDDHVASEVSEVSAYKQNHGGKRVRLRLLHISL